MNSSKKGSSRYYKVSGKSNVDESLFGNTGSPREMSKSGRSSTRRLVTGPIDVNSVVVSEYELDHIKKSAIIRTEEQLMAERELAQKIRDEKEKKANARKARMHKLEALAKKNAKKSDLELEREAKNKATLEMAEERITQNSDVVKLLTTLGTRAAAFTIRDRQIEEKERREETEREYERRLDLMMEVDRLKDLQFRENKENSMRSKRFEDRKTITYQIEERNRQRLRDLEARQQESQQQRAIKEKYDEEDRIAAEKRRIDVEKSRLEVLEANADAIRRKKEAREKEKDEMAEIVLYQEKRAAEMARREEEEAATAQRKKEMQIKMLRQQEKANNSQSDIDELRARRAAEEKERVYRRKEQEEVKKRKKDLKELNAARKQQADDRRRRIEDEKKQDIYEHHDALAYTNKMLAREQREKAHKEKLAEEHRQGIMNQIEERAELKRRDRADKFDDGSGAREKFLSDHSKLETIREKMVRDLEEQGVNPRYLTEMRAVDIKKILNR